MRYRREGDIILISRNKRHVLKKVKEMWKNEDGCLDCTLFDVCLNWGRVCCSMIKAGVIENDEGLFFIEADENKSDRPGETGIRNRERK